MHPVPHPPRPMRLILLCPVALVVVVVGHMHGQDVFEDDEYVHIVMELCKGE